MRRSTRMLVIGVLALLVSAGAVVASATSRDAGPSPAVDRDTATTQAAAAEDAETTEGSVQAQADGAYANRIPDGMQAVSVRVGPAAGLAGYVQPGDHVNVHAVVDERADDPGAPVGDLDTPFAKLVLPGVEVLDVRGPEPGAEGTVTYLLALEADDAERLIFLTSFESLWLTLVGEGQDAPAVGSGSTYGDLP